MPRLREADILSAALLRRFEAEGELQGGEGRYYGMILRDDGSPLVHHPIAPSLDPVQTIWAVDLLHLLNRELHHDGAWVVVFTHPQPTEMGNILLNPSHARYGRYAIMWMDADGDVQFSMEWERGVTSDLKEWPDVVAEGIEAKANKAEAAWQAWYLAMRKVLEVKDGVHTFKRAKGEQAPSQ